MAEETSALPHLQLLLNYSPPPPQVSSLVLPQALGRALVGGMAEETWLLLIFSCF